MILNLPATVEMAHAEHLRRPDRMDVAAISRDATRSCCRSTRTTTAAAASPPPSSRSWPAPSASRAACFGNGERTGNVCLVTLGLNLFTQGVDPGIDFSDINDVDPHGRALQPAAGASAPSVRRRSRVHGVFRFAPGRDQEGLAARATEVARGNSVWDVPYLPIDPADVGRTYDAVIRVNSQSGKGGIAYLLERDYGLALPRLLQIEFSQVIQRITDATGKELVPADIHAAFEREYVAATLPVAYAGHRAQHNVGGRHGRTA